jgi:hypothetical protein
MSTIEITTPLTPLVIRRATLLDVDRIAAIEKKSFYNGGGHARFLALQVAVRIAILICDILTFIMTRMPRNLSTAKSSWFWSCSSMVSSYRMPFGNVGVIRAIIGMTRRQYIR